MVCACAAGNWQTGTVKTNHVETESINKYLGATHVYATSKDDHSSFYPAPMVTDTGVSDNARWAALAAVAVATVNTVAMLKIADKQNKIAREYYKIAKRKWDRFKDKYMPCEKQEMAEACGTPEYDAQYDQTGNTWGDEARKDFALAGQSLSRIMSQYCLCPEPDLSRDLALASSIMAGDSTNFGYRYEESRKDAQDDRRWTRRQQSLNRGRNIEAQAAKYADMAANAYNDMGKSIGQAAEGAMSFAGYFMNRNQTRYPQRNPVQYPTSSMLGGSFTGADPQNGQYGFTNVNPMQVVTPDIGYMNQNTPYNTNSTIGSNIGSQNVNAG